MENNQIVISVSNILTDLENGLDRASIQEKYELNTGQMKKLFQHPKLKGKRAKADIGLQIIDDTVSSNQTNLLDEIKYLTNKVDYEEQYDRNLEAEEAEIVNETEEDNFELENENN